MKKQPFSLNYDESTVSGVSLLDLNASFVNDFGLIEKRMLTTIVIEEGTTGLELADYVWSRIIQYNLNPDWTMSLSTDGCSAMLGTVRGAVTILRGRIETLPRWGGKKADSLITDTFICHFFFFRD